MQVISPPFKHEIVYICEMQARELQYFLQKIEIATLIEQSTTQIEQYVS